MTAKKRSILDQLLEFDHEISRGGKKTKKRTVLVGVDEVGRGCLAGPVVAAAVIFPSVESGSETAAALALLNDSKKLKPENRELIAAVLRKHCRYAIAEASVKEIDRVNILQATFLAMRRALNELSPPEDCLVIVDGDKEIPRCTLPQSVVVKGDGLSASIAAASILAKVHRDGLMKTLAIKHPQYKWESNKGYGSLDHRNAIAEHGLTKMHRKKFCQNLAELLPTQLTIL